MRLVKKTAEGLFNKLFSFQMGRTIIVITHDRHVADQVVWFMDDGWCIKFEMKRYWSLGNGEYVLTF